MILSRSLCTVRAEIDLVFVLVIMYHLLNEYAHLLSVHFNTILS